MWLVMEIHVLSKMGSSTNNLSPLNRNTKIMCHCTVLLCTLPVSCQMLRTWLQRYAMCKIQFLGVEVYH